MNKKNIKTSSSDEDEEVIKEVYKHVKGIIFDTQ